jgi:hypothetical protein
MLYGPNAKVGGGGENAANYANPEFDALFEKMKFLDDGPEKEAIIARMGHLVQVDVRPGCSAIFPIRAGHINNGWAMPSLPKWCATYFNT